MPMDYERLRERARAGLRLAASSALRQTFASESRESPPISAAETPPTATQRLAARAGALWATPVTRVTLVMCCLFAGTGMIMPYLGRWLEVERGLIGAEIGAVLSLSQMARLLIGPSVAIWADGAHDRRAPIRILAGAAVVAYFVFFTLAHSFAALMITGFIALSLTQALTPFVEAAALRATAQGRISYGVARGIGSVAFIVANVGGGILIARFGLGAVAAWVLTVFALLNLSAWRLKPDLAPEHVRGLPWRTRLTTGARLLRDRGFLGVIIACGLIQAGHAFYYGFSTLVWRAQGVAPETVGLLWGVGVAVEVAFLWTLPFFERRVSPERLIHICAAAGVVRWTALAFGPTGWVLWPLQALHGVTFAAGHVGAMRLIFRMAPEESTGFAQTLYSATAAGVLMGLATLASGVLYDLGSFRGYWLMAAMAAAGGAIALWLLKPSNVGVDAPQA